MFLTFNFDQVGYIDTTHEIWSTLKNPRGQWLYQDQSLWDMPIRAWEHCLVDWGVYWFHVFTLMLVVNKMHSNKVQLSYYDQVAPHPRSERLGDESFVYHWVTKPWDPRYGWAIQQAQIHKDWPPNSSQDWEFGAPTIIFVSGCDS